MADRHQSLTLPVFDQVFPCGCNCRAISDYLAIPDWIAIAVSKHSGSAAASNGKQRLVLHIAFRDKKTLKKNILNGSWIARFSIFSFSIVSFLIFMSGNTNECGFHNPIGKKIEKPETLLCSVRFSLTLAPIFQSILLKKVMAKFLRRTKHYLIAAEVRKSNFLSLSWRIFPRRCLYCLTPLLFDTFLFAKIFGEK